MSHRGFTLVELLVALTVCALLSGAIAGVMVPARAAFDSTPSVLDLQQRSRTGVDVLATTIRSAGATVGAAEGLGPLAAAMPVVMPLPAADDDPRDGAFAVLVVISVVPGAAQGVLDRDQPWPQGPLTLASASSCPQASDVCGFRPGATAAILDGRGRFDVLTVASADAARHELRPAARLTAAYGAGAVVVEVETSRFELAPQADGSRALVRITSGGATQPIVDGVSHVGFEPWGAAAAPVLAWDGARGWASYGPRPAPPDAVDPQGEFAEGETCVSAYEGGEPRTRLSSHGESGALVPMERADFEDGPWCPGGLDGHGYDADVLRLRRIDFWMRVEVLSATLRGPAGRLFSRGGSAAHAPVRWVPDRLVKAVVTLRNLS